MAAAATQLLPAPPGLFTFLLPPRIRGLVLPFLALTAALTTAFLFPVLLHLQPGSSYGVILDADAISRTDPRSVAYPALVEGIRGELRRLLRDIGMVLLLAVVVGSSSRAKRFVFLVLATVVLSNALHLFQCLVLAARAGIYTDNDNVSVPYLLAAAAGSAAYVATVFAAVPSRSSGASPSSLILRPVLTAALGGTLKLACGAMVAYNPLPAPVLDKVVIFLALLLYACVEFVFRLAVVVSVAEPGVGTGAMGRAWRLMRRGKCEQAQSYLVQQWILDSAFRLVYALVTMAGWPRGAASGVVVQMDAIVMCLLLMAEEMLTVAKTTAYYFQCGKIEEEEGKEENKAGHAD